MNMIEKDGAVTFAVRVVPRASKSEVMGIHDGALKLRIACAPVDGAANREVIRLLAKYFGVAKGDVIIVSGETSKNKRIKIANLSKSRCEEIIK